MVQRSAAFCLRTFGRLALTDADGRDDPSLATRPRKLAVLAWLALRPGGRATRDRIIGVFWGERDEERARNSLSDALSHLRRVLGRGAIETVADEVLVHNLVVDVLEMCAAAGAGDHEKVVSLHTGPFLDGFYIEGAPEFDDWRDRERAKLAAQFSKSAAVRCRELAARESWDDCRALAERWLDADVASSDAALAWLRAIGAPGTRAADTAVVSAYESLVRRLDHEVGIAPDASVTAFTREAMSRLAAPSCHHERSEGSAFRSESTPPIQRVEPTPVAQPPSPRRRRFAPSLFAGGVVVLAATMLAMRTRSTTLDQRRVIVAVFENRTGDSALAPLGRVAADWISRGLAETPDIQVVNPIAGSPSLSASVDPRAIGRDARAGVVVVGAYVRVGDSLTVEARLIDANDGRVLRAIEPAMSLVARPIVAVDLVRQRVAGALAAHVDPMLAVLARGSDQPPTYAAYLAWVDGIDRFSHRDFLGSVEPLLRAASLDSNFLTPRIWAAAGYANSGDPVRADSMLQSIVPLRTRLSTFDRCFLDVWLATMRGDHPSEYAAAKAGLAAAPGSELARFLAGFGAMTVNRPNEAVSLLKEIHVARSAAAWDDYGNHLAQALHYAGRYDEELTETRRRRAARPTLIRAMEDEARVVAAIGKTSDIERLAREIAVVPPQAGRNAATVLLVFATELEVHDHPKEASTVYRRVIELGTTGEPDVRGTMTTRYAVGRSFYRIGELERADVIFDSLVAERPNNVSYLAYKGLVAARRGDTVAAERVSAELERLGVKIPFVRGLQSTARARIAALLGRKEEAVRLLRQGIGEGQWMNEIHLHPELLRLRGYSPFDALIRPAG